LALKLEAEPHIMTAVVHHKNIDAARPPRESKVYNLCGDMNMPRKCLETVVSCLEKRDLNVKIPDLSGWLKPITRTISNHIIAAVNKQNLSLTQEEKLSVITSNLNSKHSKAIFFASTINPIQQDKRPGYSAFIKDEPVKLDSAGNFKPRSVFASSNLEARLTAEYPYVILSSFCAKKAFPNWTIGSNESQ
jgi:hypothetical protein